MEDRKAQFAVSVFFLGVGLGSLVVYYGLRKYIDSNRKKIEDEGYNKGAIETHQNFKQLLKWAAGTGADSYTLLQIVQQTENSNQ